MPRIDVARALAINGMVTVHVGPTDQGHLVGRLYALPRGRASLLFFLLAGVGVSLLARSRRSAVGAARRTLAWRAALLLPGGLALQSLDHGAFVVLPEYALLFLAAVALVGVADRWLLALAGVLAVAGPTIHLVGQMRAPETFEWTGLSFADSVPEIVHGLVLSGPYPLIIWAVPFLFGIWLGRRDLRDPRLRAHLILGGATAAAGAWALSAMLVSVVGDPVPPAGWDHLIARSAHSQMPLWLLGGTGLAALGLSASPWLTNRAGSRVWPLAAMGQLALTVYVGHLLALHLAPAALTPDQVGRATLVVLVFVATAMALATAWRALAPHGPLEALLRPPRQLLGAATDRQG